MRPPPAPLAITGAGIASSLGGHPQAILAARAGLTRVSPLPELALYDSDILEPTPVNGHPVPEAAGFEGIGKRAVLLAGALADLEAQGALFDPASTAVLIGTSSGFHAAQLAARLEAEAKKQNVPVDFLPDEAARQQYLEQFLLDRTLRGGPLEQAAVRKLVASGEAAFAALLGEASTLLQSGRARACVVGAVDSMLDARLLRILLGLDALKTPEKAVGFMPGEAGAVLLLERPEDARRRGAQVLAIVEGAVVVSDLEHRYSGSPPPRGHALAQALQSAAGGQPVSEVVGSLNGDEWRAHDWGHAAVRLQTAPALRSAVVGAPWSPAQAWGELGAATPVMAACFAVHLAARARAEAGRVLVWTAGDDGMKTAFCVRRAG